jgi:UDP-galactopyranose mutase
MDLSSFRYLVVGSGFFGATVAERIAEELGERVAVIERRPHSGGNSFSEIDEETGIECHSYGSHIFHTMSEKVWTYINRFSRFNNYHHKVLTTYNDRVFQMPINLFTINAFYGKNLKPSEALALIEEEISREQIESPSNLEEKAISLIGRPLYEAFIKGYTAKQWGTDPRELPPHIITRLHLRFNYDTAYFDDPWQGMPMAGYHGIFKNMLMHRNIALYLSTDFFQIRKEIPETCLIIYSGPIDRFFDFKYGRLGWRTQDFEKEIISADDYQGTAVMNFADPSVPYTRIHEFKHFHKERQHQQGRTAILREYSRNFTEGSEPYYPVNAHQDRLIHAQYLAEASRADNVLFGGRLGLYRYLNMDEVIKAALELFENKIMVHHRA